MNKAIALVVAGVMAAAVMAASPSPAPSTSPRPSSKPARLEPATKFALATKEQADAARALADKLFVEARKFATAMHLVETDHFLIYSEWEKSADKPLSDLAEGLYGALCRQFDIPVKQNIWIGKCPIYTFFVQEHYRKFTMEVDGAKAERAAGYCSYRNGVCYMVMDYRDSRSDFNTVLVHETTHAFLSRYLTNRNVPLWLNEGLAETMAATLVPDGFAARRWEQATREAVKLKANITKVFEEVRLLDYDYGIAQSVVRFLIRDKKAFIKLVTLLKEGKSEEDALMDSFKLTRPQLVKAWSAAVGIK